MKRGTPINVLAAALRQYSLVLLNFHAAMSRSLVGDSESNPIWIDSSPSPLKVGLLSDRYGKSAMLHVVLLLLLSFIVKIYLAVLTVIILQHSQYCMQRLIIFKLFTIVWKKTQLWEAVAVLKVSLIVMSQTLFLCKFSMYEHDNYSRL